MVIIWTTIVLGVLAFLASRYIYRQKVVWIAPKDWWLWIASALIYHVFVSTPLLAQFNFNDSFVSGMYILSLLAALSFYTWNLERRPYIFLLLGGLLNTIAIVMNGGFMPVSPQYGWFIHGFALAIDGTRIPFSHSVILSDPNVWILTDIFYLRIPHYQTVAFSIGDIFVCLGLFDYLSGEVKNESNK